MTHALRAPDSTRNQLGRYWRDPDWQRVWLATQEASWRSLAILPAEVGLSSWDVAQALLDVGWQHRGTPIVVADLRTVTLAHVDSLVTEVRRHVDGGETVLIALSCVDESPAAAHVARAADQSLLCVRLGSTSMRLAETTVHLVGKERFLGTLVVRPGAERRPMPGLYPQLPKGSG